MPALPRKTQQLFGGALVAAGNVSQFGSLAASAPVYSLDLAVIQALAAFQNGFQAAVVGNKSPAMQDLNGLFLLITQQLAYLMQSGVPEYDAGTTYWQHQFARVGHSLYVSLTNNNTAHDPTSDTNNWVPYQNILVGPTVAAAWVEFDGINSSGGNALIHSSFNVDHVLRNGDGSYTVVFATALPSAHYAMMGSCGSEDGQAYGAGDDGVVVGNVTGQGNAIRSAAQCRIFTINPTNKALVTSGDVSVLFFGR